MKNNYIIKPLILTAVLSSIPMPSAAITKQDDKIHFISTGQSDAILIESNGKYGLVDSGEDTGTSRTRLPQSEIDAIKDLPGYEKEILEYLNSLGIKKLDFAIATHAHSDHIGNFDLIFDEIPTKTLYTREYKDTYINSDNKKENLFLSHDEYTWDNQEVYDDMIHSANRNNVDIIYIDENSTLKDLNFKFEDFTIDIVNNQTYNTEEERQNIKIHSENSNSFGVVVSKNNTKAFLAGDIGNSDNDENYLISNERTKDLLKDVDVFKFGHHGINGTVDFLSHINPKLSIITGAKPKSYTTGYQTISSLGLKNIYTTAQNSNIVVDFNDSGIVTSNAHTELTLFEGWKVENDKLYYIKDDEPLKGFYYLSRNNEYNWYYFNNLGVMQTGWQSLNYQGKDNWYYFDASGKMLTGWQQIKHNGQDNWYYFDIDGVMQTEWQNINYNGVDNWYYFDVSGKMLTGWQQISYNGHNDWYYFDKSGKVLTDWQELSYKGNNTWYYFDFSGKMMTGWQEISYKGQNDWYFFNSDGSMKTGYLYDNNKTYYLRENAEETHLKGSLL